MSTIFRCTLYLCPNLISTGNLRSNSSDAYYSLIITRGNLRPSDSDTTYQSYLFASERYNFTKYLKKCLRFTQIR